MTKPFQFEKVSARVETHLHLRKMKSELEKYNLHHIPNLSRKGKRP